MNTVKSIDRAERYFGSDLSLNESQESFISTQKNYRPDCHGTGATITAGERDISILHGI
jgi:hypothetical protein